MIILAAVVLAVGAGIFVYIRARRAARDFSQNVFGTDSLTEAFARQQYENATTPKSVSATTSICLPRIKRDFPQFNYEDMRTRCINVVTSYFHAIDQGDARLLSEGSPELQEALKLRIRILKDAGQSEQFDKIRVHQAEIFRYRKEKGCCCVEFQCSYQSKHALMSSEGKILKGSLDTLEQGRCNVELVYIQDADEARENNANALGLTCPNCGAPIKTLGTKHCEYCGAGIVEVNIHAWAFHSVKEA